MPEQYIRNGDDRIAIWILAINDDRVLYRYSYDDKNKIGCISRGFFDANYQRVD